MEKISVSIRVRPLDKQEIIKGSPWKIADNTIALCSASGTVLAGQTYTFDSVFATDSKTLDIYEESTKDIVASAVKGFNGTVFAYGQTSSGKTYTMRGNPHEPGIIPLAVHDVFKNIQEAGEREFLLRMSYMEIYNEEINDLLAPEHRKLQVHESLERGIFVAGLREEIVATPEQVLQLMEFGEAHRHIGETNMNIYSSRSHTIFRMVIESRDKSQDDSSGTLCDAVRVSVLNLVDLAGSERIAKTGAEGTRLKEGTHINKSLMTLGTVINKLSEGIESQGGHVPYRDSKLTRILQPALGGNAKTSIVCNITPALIHVDETKGTLQFASRAIRVTNCAQVNEIMTDAALLKRQKREIEELRCKLKESHSEHLEEEILNLRNTLLKSELECERIALELQEEKKAQAERERQIKEQAQKIENLSTMVLNSAVDDRDFDKRSKKNNRRETWCPRVPPMSEFHEEFVRPQKEISKALVSEVSLPKRERAFPLPPPFERLLEEDEFKVWGSSKDIEDITQGSLVLEDEEDSFNADCRFPDPSARIHVVERKRKFTTDNMTASEMKEELLDLQARYQDLECEHEVQMRKKSLELEDLRKRLANAETVANKTRKLNSKTVQSQESDRRCKSLEGWEADASLINKQLEAQVQSLQMEKFYMQRDLDRLMEQAKGQTNFANQGMEELRQELNEAKEEALRFKEDLEALLVCNGQILKEREEDLLMQLKYSAEVFDFGTEVEGMLSAVNSLRSLAFESVQMLKIDAKELKDTLSSLEIIGSLSPDKAGDLWKLCIPGDQYTTSSSDSCQKGNCQREKDDLRESLERLEAQLAEMRAQHEELGNKKCRPQQLAVDDCEVIFDKDVLPEDNAVLVEPELKSIDVTAVPGKTECQAQWKQMGKAQQLLEEKQNVTSFAERLVDGRNRVRRLLVDIKRLSGLDVAVLEEDEIVTMDAHELLSELEDAITEGIKLTGNLFVNENVEERSVNSTDFEHRYHQDVMFPDTVKTGSVPSSSVEALFCNAMSADLPNLDLQSESFTVICEKGKEVQDTEKVVSSEVKISIELKDRSAASNNIEHSGLEFETHLEEVTWLSQKIDQLEKNLSSKAVKSKELMQANVSLLEERDALQNALEKFEIERTKLMEANKSMLEEAKVFQRDFEVQRQELEDKSQKLKSEVDRLNSEVKSLSSKLEMEVSLTALAKEQLKAAEENFQREYIDLQVALQSLEEEHRNLTQANQKINDDLHSCQGELQIQKIENERWISKTHELSETVALAESKLPEVSKQNEKCSLEIEKHESMIVAFQSICDERDKLMETNQHLASNQMIFDYEIEKQKGALEEADKKLKEANLENAKAADQFSHKQSQLLQKIDETSICLGQYINECGDLKANVDGLLKEKVTLESKVSKYEMQLNELNQALITGGKDLEESQQLYQHELSLLRSELTTLRKEVKTAKLCSTAVEKEKEGLRKDLEKTKSKLKDIEAKLKTALQEKNRLETEKINAERELKHLRGQSSLLQRDISKRDSLADKKRESIACGLNKAKNQLVSTEQALQMKNVELEKASFEIQLLQDLHAKLEISLAEAEDDKKLLEEKLEAAENEMFISNEQKEKAHCDAEKMLLELEAALEQLKATSTELDALKIKHDTLEENFQACKTAHLSMESTVAELAKVKEELALQLTDAYLELEEEKAALAANEKIFTEKIAHESEKKSDMMIQKTILTDEITKLKIQLESATEKCSQFQEEAALARSVAEELQLARMAESSHVGNLTEMLHLSEENLSEERNARIRESSKTSELTIKLHDMEGCLEGVLCKEKELSEAHALLETMKSEKTCLESRILHLEELVLKEKSTACATGKKLEQLHIELQWTKEQMTKLQNEAEIRDEDLLAQNVKLNDLLRQHQYDLEKQTHLVKENMMLQVSFDAATARAEVFHGRLQEALEETKVLFEAAERASVPNNLFKQLKEDLASARLEVVDLKVQIEKGRDDCSRYQQDLELVKQKSSANDVLKERRIKELIYEKNCMEERLAQLEKHLKACRDDLMKLHVELKARTVLITELQVSLREMHNDKSSLQAQIAALRSDVHQEGLGRYLVEPSTTKSMVTTSVQPKERRPLGLSLQSNVENVDYIPVTRSAMGVQGSFQSASARSTRSALLSLEGNIAVERRLGNETMELDVSPVSKAISLNAASTTANIAGRKGHPLLGGLGVAARLRSRSRSDGSETFKRNR